MRRVRLVELYRRLLETDGEGSPVPSTASEDHEGDEEMDGGMSPLYDDAPDSEPDEAVRWISDTKGRWILDSDQVAALSAKGFEAYGDLMYHPDHWEPAGDDWTYRDRRPGAVVTGEDGALRSKTPEAEKWAKAPWWRPFSAKGGQSYESSIDPEDLKDAGPPPKVDVFVSGQSQVGQDAKYGGGGDGKRPGTGGHSEDRAQESRRRAR